MTSLPDFESGRGVLYSFLIPLKKKVFWAHFCLHARVAYEMIRIMKRVGKISRHLSQAWLAGVWIFLIAYFAFHAFQGDNSLAALKRLEVQEQELAVVAAEVRMRRTVLEDRTSKLGNRGLDPDMLEEQVRRRLGFTHPDEIVVFVTEASH